MNLTKAHLDTFFAAPANCPNDYFVMSSYECIYRDAKITIEIDAMEVLPDGTQVLEDVTGQRFIAEPNSTFTFYEITRKEVTLPC